MSATPKRISEAAKSVADRRYAKQYDGENDNGLLATQLILYAILANMTEPQRAAVLVTILAAGTL